MKHICFGHKEKMDLEPWQWSKVKFLGNIRWICNKCIYCEGCKEYHPMGKYGGARGFGHPTRWVCFKWTKSTPKSIKSKIADMSPEEVMSGVQYGNERLGYLGKDTNDWSKEHAQEKDNLGKALDKI